MRFSKENAFALASTINVIQYKMKRMPFYVVPFAILTTICASVLFVDSLSRSSSLALTSFQPFHHQEQQPIIDLIPQEKPIMHTFWESVPGGCCGANELGHQQLIDAWKDAWHRNGWETKILTMEDVYNHPDYEEMTRLFENFDIAEYDKRCFYRWLAMGNQANGGWMSDYDLFPMHFTGDESYNLIERNGNGRFTSYANWAPALNYGTKNEWNRLIKLIIKFMSPKVFNGPQFTDMYVFRQLAQDLGDTVGIIYEPDEFVSRLGFKVYETDAHTLNCEILKDQKAIHFSHYSTDVSNREGRFPLKNDGQRPSQNRGRAAGIFMNDLYEQCKQPNPVMHTFWESVPGGCCGADELGHQQLIDAWEDAWHRNGWETKILTMEDVYNHPDYEEMTRLFENFDIAEYDKRCFYRWLAMGNQANGGWMSDYDLFPMHFTGDESYAMLQRNGNERFTSYAHFAPALNYASRDEWNRLVKLLMEYMSPKVFNGPQLTDMYVFKQIVEAQSHKLGVIYGPDQFVSRLGFKVYDTDGHTLNCEELKKQRAIHFSHYSTDVAFKEGRFPIKREGEEPAQNRGLAAALFINDLDEQCNDSTSTA